MIDIVDMFIQCGGDATIQNKNGFTCLHVAAKLGYLDMCKLLVNKGKTYLVIQISYFLSFRCGS